MAARNAGTNVEVHILSHVRPILWGERVFLLKTLVLILQEAFKIRDLLSRQGF